MASVTLPTGGSVPKGLESHTKERKEIRIIDIVRNEIKMKISEVIKELVDEMVEQGDKELQEDTIIKVSGNSITILE